MNEEKMDKVINALLDTSLDRYIKEMTTKLDSFASEMSHQGLAVTDLNSIVDKYKKIKEFNYTVILLEKLVFEKQARTLDIDRSIKTRKAKFSLLKNVAFDKMVKEIMTNKNNKYSRDDVINLVKSNNDEFVDSSLLETTCEAFLKPIPEKQEVEDKIILWKSFVQNILPLLENLGKREIGNMPMEKGFKDYDSIPKQADEDSFEVTHENSNVFNDELNNQTDLVDIKSIDDFENGREYYEYLRQVLVTNMANLQYDNYQFEMIFCRVLSGSSYDDAIKSVFGNRYEKNRNEPDNDDINEKTVNLDDESLNSFSDIQNNSRLSSLKN